MDLVGFESEVRSYCYNYKFCNLIGNGCASYQHQVNMFKCMSAILHLGNVDFTEDDSERAHVSSTSELVVTAVSY